MAKKSNKPEVRLSDSAGGTGTTEKKKEKTKAVTMAEKRAKQSKNKPKQKAEKGRILEYFRGVKLEMKKVVWPTRNELSSFTAVVLATCVVFALLFWGIDSGVLAAIKAICF